MKQSIPSPDCLACSKRVPTCEICSVLKRRMYRRLKRLIRLHLTFRVLFYMTDFHGWEPSAAWEDFKFGIKHFADIERLAMVGENWWQYGMAVFCKPFTKTTVRYFEHADADEARKWLGVA